MRGMVQIAGVLDEEEARGLLSRGVDWIGIPLRLAVHRPDLDEASAARLIARIPDDRAVVITYLDDPDEIVPFCRDLGVHRIQLHGDMSPAQLRRLREKAPQLYVIKSLIVTESTTAEHLLERAAGLAPFVDMFITDSYDPLTGACGATGRIHDWSISRALARASTRPVMLAGGLRPGNVVGAIHEVGPAGVDAHTGVEGPDGRKDLELVGAFVVAARMAFAARGAAAAPVMDEVEP